MVTETSDPDIGHHSSSKDKFSDHTDEHDTLHCDASEGRHGECQFTFSGDFLPESFRVSSTQLAVDIVTYIRRHEHSQPAPNKTCVIMRSLVDDTLKERLSMMNSLVSKLDVKSHKDLQLLHNIATSLFDDQMVNWGRVVTFHAFCGYLARHCEERRIYGCTEIIAETLASIVINRLGLWIVANGGWSAFEKQFPPVCVWDAQGLWKGVAVIILLVAAALAFYFSIRYSISG